VRGDQASPTDTVANEVLMRDSWSYEETNRAGDHIWWVSDVRKFQAHYPAWHYEYDIRGILSEIHGEMLERK
jgi:CDP-paratose 2-epimerase